MSNALVFVFAAAKADQERLAAAVQEAIPADAMEVHQSLESLHERLSKPGKKSDVAVILAASEKELRKVLAIGHLLAKVRTVLILPDGEAETVALGHRLGARYLGYADTDLSDLAAVLKKMVKNKKTAQKKSKKEKEGRSGLMKSGSARNPICRDPGVTGTGGGENV